MSKIDLKPCPFCGGEARQGNTQLMTSHVYCKDCESATGAHFNPDSAFVAWNTRYESAKASEQPSMGKRVMYDDGTSSREYEEQPVDISDDDPVGDAYAKGYADGYKAKALATKREMITPKKSVDTCED